jgi:hypothetical protein
LPLVELEPANHARLQASLSEAGLLRRK